MEDTKKIPLLRFPEFLGEWEVKKIREILESVSDSVKVEKNKVYQQIGIRSHGKGIFHKEFVTGESLGNKRVFWVKRNKFIVNIVFAWEQAVAKTTKNEQGMIASHRFPMYTPLNDMCSIDYILYKFLTKKGKNLLELASPGGAGRNKTLGQGEFKKLKIVIPPIQEQQKISDFLTKIDTKIEQLSKKKIFLENYKKGVMQKIFSQELRFKDDNENYYPDWEEKSLGEVATFRRGSFPQPYGLEKWYDHINGKPFVQVFDVNSNMRLKENTKRKISKKAEKLSVFVEKDSIVLTIQGSIGRVALTQYDSFVDRTLLIFTSYLLPINKKFFTYLIFLLFEIEKLKAPGGTIKTITKEVLTSFKVKIPFIEEQKKISNFLFEIDNKINVVEKQLNDTKK